MTDAPRLSVQAIELYERPVHMRLPFRFGVVTLTHCPQAFVRVRIATSDGRSAWGAAAELMAPKWFDKNLQLSNEDNFDQLRRSLTTARDAYLSHSGARTAFGHFADHYAALIAAGQAAGLNPLIACYGPALIDRALLDALCRAQALSFYDAIRRNVPGMDVRLCADLSGFDLAGFLHGLAPAAQIALRHTVGLVDAITAADADVDKRLNDGLPGTLEDVVASTGCRHYKLKVSGAADADIDRLTRIAEALAPVADCVVTLDGNEQFPDAPAAAEFWRRVQATPALQHLARSTLYIEQPLPRAIALDTDVRPLAVMRPVLIDESDGTLEAFPRALELGYTGVSSKQCKGIYRSLLNAARCQQRNGAARQTGTARCFMSAEDLTTQAGLAVQQDLALVNLIGLGHVERNGHHYVDGFAGQGAGLAERQAFLAAQPGLYEPADDNVRLRVRDGLLDLRSLDRPGFASGANPEWPTLQPLQLPAR